MHQVSKILWRDVDKRYKYAYDPDARHSIYKVEGSLRDRKCVSLTSLGKTMRYLVIQVKAEAGKNFTITIRIGDDKRNHFNVAFTTHPQRSDRPSSSSTSALLPLDIPRDKWMVIYFDLRLIAAQRWGSYSFHFLDGLEISPTCQISKIFVQENAPVRGPDNEFMMPAKELEFPNGLDFSTMMIPSPEPPVAHITPERKSGIPTRVSTSKTPSSSGSVRRSGPMTHKTPATAYGFKPSSKSNRKPKIVQQEVEEDSDDDCAFDGTVPSSGHSDIEINRSLPQNEEEELELVYIEEMGCYYCPSNQQYYTLDN